MSASQTLAESTMLPGLLVSTDWLEGNLGAPNLAIVDIRGYVKTIDLGGGKQKAEYTGARDEFDAGHLPGSTFVDWTSDIVDLDAEVKAQIAPPERFKAAMEAIGVGDETDVVIVDHAGGHFATRLWWALRYYGHDRIAVLDGGFNKWTSEGKPLTTDSPSIEPAIFTPTTRPELRVEADKVLGAMADKSALIVDARDSTQYSGEVSRGSRGGHIPGAVNISAKLLVNADGTWKPAEELDALLSAGGADADRPVIAYCNGGVTATAVLFALVQTGRTHFANYDGSWNEWGERPELPVEESR